MESQAPGESTSTMASCVCLTKNAFKQICSSFTLVHHHLMTCSVYDFFNELQPLIRFLVTQSDVTLVKWVYYEFNDRYVNKF